MLQFVLRKMLNKKWLMAALLVGNILLVAIAAGNPMYTEAALQRMLTGTLSSYVTQNGRYATTAYLLSSVPANSREGSSAIEYYQQERDMVYAMPERLGLRQEWIVENTFMEAVEIKPTLPRSNFSSKEVRLGCLAGLPEHAKIVSGRMYSDVVEDGIIEVVVSQKALIKLNLLLNEVLELPKVTDENGEPWKIRVVGIYDAADAEDHYWYKSPSTYESQLMMSEQIYRDLFGSMVRLPCKSMGLWFVVMDYHDVTVDNAEFLYQEAQKDAALHKERNNVSYNEYYSGILEQYLVDAARVRVTLRILQIPIYALLAAFIFMVSGQILSMEQSEISVIKSRGAGRRQILGIYLLQSVLVAGVSLAVGLPLSAVICQVLGSANAFLEFVSRKALQVRYTRDVWIYGCGAALLSMLAMVLPSIRYARLSIVAQKQKKRKSDKPWFQRFYLDFLLLGVSLYGLYTFNGQKAALAQKVLEGEGLDPLLYLSSSLFVIGAGLVALRIVPLIAWLVYTIGKKRWSPAMYSSFLQVMRTRSSQGYIIAFLVITLAIGIFNAQTARTINANEENRIAYMNGADIVLQEAWEDNRDEAQSPDDLIGFQLRYTEPDFGKYNALDGAEVITKVMYDEGAYCSLKEGSRSVPCLLMGINVKEFGECVDFQTDLLPVHWYEYLNAMAVSPRAVLVSTNLQDFGYELGDSIYYRSAEGNRCHGIIYGFVDYWPGYNPKTTITTSDGSTAEISHFLVVAHLRYIQNNWGITPYQIWMKAKDSTDFIYDFAAESGVKFTTFRDSRAQLIELKNDPIFQGTNGILTLCFVVVLLLCAVGFLIYWILSIRSRTLLMGIFRAMGMTLGEIVGMLANEQVFISGVSIALGVAVGLIASKLYVPLVQLAYASTDTVLPLQIISDSGDMARLLCLVAAMVILCMVILGVLVKKIKISQALKLGED